MSEKKPANQQEPTCVLLAEDSPDDIFFFQRALEKTGLQTVLEVADDGAEVIAYLSSGGPLPSIMFLDLKMPNVNGFEVLEWMIKQPFASAIRVVVLTSSEEPHERHAAQNLGAADFITKPVSSDRLRREIELALSNPARTGMTPQQVNPPQPGANVPH